MRKVSFVVVLFLLVTMISISLSGCGRAGEKVAEKTAEKAMEKVMEKATGGEVDLTKDGAKIEIEGQSIVVGDKMPWPKDSMGDLPEPDGKVGFVMKGGEGEGANVILSEFQDGKGYLDKLKNLGYEDVMRMEMTDGFIYAGKKELSGGKSALVNITYSSEGQNGSISYSIE
jgi:hypothetical protein